MRSSTLWTVVRLAVAGALLTYLVRSGALDAAALGRLASEWPIVTAALVVLFVDLCITAWRLCLLLRVRGLVLALSASVRLTLIGTFFSICLPGSAGGDLVRMYYATAGGEDQRADVLTLLVIDRAIGLFAMLLWPVIAAPFFLPLIASSSVLTVLVWSAAGSVLAMAAAAALFSRPAPARMVAGVLSKAPLVHLTTAALDTIVSTVRAPRILTAVVAVSLLGHTLSMAVLVLVARALNPGVWSPEIGVLAAFGFVANSLPLTPGGLGVGEAAFDGLFRLAGIPHGAQVMLGWRVLMALLGLVGLAAFVHGKSRVHYGREPLPAAGSLSSLGPAS